MDATYDRIRADWLSVDEVVRAAYEEVGSRKRCPPKPSFDKKHMIVFSGPGAVGKGTLKALIASRFPSCTIVKNITTRARRSDTDSEYIFCTQEEISTLATKGRILGMHTIEGRGQYGVSVDELDRVSSCAFQLGIMEELATTVSSILPHVSKRFNVLGFFILPPAPFIETLINRLFLRQPHHTIDQAISTLSVRQVNDIAAALHYPNLKHFQFIVNDDLEATSEEIWKVISSSMSTISD